MNYREQLDKVAGQFLELIKKAPNCEEIYTEDFGWENYRYKSDLFRLAHVERYGDEKIEVLHVTTFPHKDSPEPIYGFDCITIDKMVIGCYMDLSPGINQYLFHQHKEWGDKKPIPEWASVFSDNFIVMKPVSNEEFVEFCDWSVDRYDWYAYSILDRRTKGVEEDIIKIQNNYCDIQSKNPRTYNVLKAKIGEERARYFMEEILFPRI
jgi:hypothetical protein